VPALRLLSANGRCDRHARRYLEPEALVKWLKEQHDKAAAVPAEETDE